MSADTVALGWFVGLCETMLTLMLTSACVLTSNVPRFLSMLEEEIYGENSPIWEADFTMPASDGTQLGHQTGEAALVNMQS